MADDLPGPPLGAGFRISRRRALQLLGGAATIPVVGALGSSAGSAVEDAQNVRAAWTAIAGNPVLQGTWGPSWDPNRVFATLLPAGKLMNGTPSGAPWYLWTWHHDNYHHYPSDHCRWDYTPPMWVHLHTAPSPEGPFTPHPNGPFPLPQFGLPAGYNRYHLDMGDIVWDPVGHRFIATPHAFKDAIVPGNAEISMDSFLLQSTNGMNWSFLDGDNRPRLKCGPPGSDDSVNTGYGRLLRDLDGNLVKHDGNYWWLYRGSRRDAGSTTYYYRPLYARAPNLSDDWIKAGRAFSPLAVTATGNFTIGSFVSAASRKWVYYTETADVGLTNVTMLMASNGNNMGVGVNRLIVPLPTPGILAYGPYVIRRPDTYRQYLVQNSETDFESCPPATGGHTLGKSRIDIYRANQP